MSAASIVHELDTCRDTDRNRVLGRLARQFEDELTGLKKIPDEYIDVLIKVISSDNFTKLNNSAQFILNAYLDIEKINKDQKLRILESIIQNYHNYRSEELYIVASDFIARCFPVTVALDAISSIGENLPQEGFYGLLVALDILQVSKELDSDLLKRIKSMRLSINSNF